MTSSQATARDSRAAAPAGPGGTLFGDSAAAEKAGAVIALLTMSLVFSACANVATRRAATTAQALGQNKGIVVVSTSTESPCEFGGSYIEIRKEGALFSSAEMNLTQGLAPSDFDDRYGMFDAFVLAPGLYAISRLAPGGYFQHALIGVFDVRPGELTYVGDVGGVGCVGMFIGRSLQVSFGNDWERVRPKLAQRFPGLDPAKVLVNLLATEPWVERREAAPPSARAEKDAPAAGERDATAPDGLVPPHHLELAHRVGPAAPVWPTENLWPRRPTWTFGALMGFAYGGAKMVTAFHTDGTSATLRSGTGLIFSAYAARALFTAGRHSALAGVELGIKGWNIGGGDDADYSVSLVRFPVTPAVRYLYGETPGTRLMLGAGAQYELGVTLSSSGAAAGLGTTAFDNALGWMGEVGVLLEGAHAGATFSLRYTDIDYRGAGLPDVDARSVAFLMGFQGSSFVSTKP